MDGASPSSIVWRKSSASQGGEACVEVAFSRAGVLVRDSKNKSGPVLGFSHAEWNAFLLGVQAGEFLLIEPSETGDYPE